MYLFLFDYVIKVINEIFSEIDYNETDLFERIRQIGLAKLRAYKKHPQIFDFLNDIVKAGELTNEIDGFVQELISNSLERCYQNIDFSKFRKDLNLEKITNIINWTMLCFSEEQISKMGSVQKISIDNFNEWEEYANILKRSFYKKEYICDD